MSKNDITPTTYFEQVMRWLTDTGLLLVSKDAKGKPNAMTIGWGALGSIWGKPLWIVLVRPSRHTYHCIEHTGDFTVNVPTNTMKAAVSFCGTKSGRDCDKFAAMNLTAVPGRVVNVPIIEQCAIHYECRVVHHNDVLPSELAKDIQTGAYKSGDYHRVYYGEILACYADDTAAVKLV